MKIQNSKGIKFSFSADKEVRLVTAPGVFSPNATTTLLIQAVSDKITKPVTLLDLGCGTGVVGLALNFKNLIQSPLYASDLSSSAVMCSKENFNRYDCSAEVRRGSLFAPWKGKKFDVIVDDISGVAQAVADVSSWFQGVPCDTGNEGTDLVVEIIKSAYRYLAEDGCIFFPVLSLSNVDMLLQVAKENFETVEKVGRLEWPLPTELKIHMPLLLELKEKGFIKLEEKFGMVLCYTEVYCASVSI